MSTRIYHLAIDFLGEEYPVKIWYEYEGAERAGPYQPPSPEVAMIRFATLGSQPNVFGQRRWLDITDLLTDRQRRSLESDILDDLRQNPELDVAS